MNKRQELEVIADNLAEQKMRLDAVLEDGKVEEYELAELIETQANLHSTLGQLESYIGGMIVAMCLLRYGHISPATEMRIISRRRDVERTYGEGRPNLKLVRPAMTPDDAA